MFIRECDGFLDAISHGFWKVPANIVLGVSIYYAYKNKNTLFQPLLTHNQTREFTFIYIGLLVIMVFSRIFGTANLWQYLVDDNYHRFYKKITQEGLELFGYTLVFYGSMLLHLKPDNGQTKKVEQ
ncbi:MAG: hypothetical protein A6F71_06140 [Cycloclasticus sp. symbiont of Poecilosclerida sp. M]|nr:MAG: hypothetical protein A6F71_06140 [Cycloclasticus sp. symbiont of Poecilosclerida sp. M]